MKHLLLLLTLILGLATLPASVFAKDKKDDDWKKIKKGLRDEVQTLQFQYNLIYNRAKYGGDRRQFEELRGPKAVLDDVNFQLDHNRYFDSRDAQEIHSRIQRAHDDLDRVRVELDNDNRRRSEDQRRYEDRGGFYRRD